MSHSDVIILYVMLMAMIYNVTLRCIFGVASDGEVASNEHSRSMHKISAVKL